MLNSINTFSNNGVLSKQKQIKPTVAKGVKLYQLAANKRVSHLSPSQPRIGGSL